MLSVAPALDFTLALTVEPALLWLLLLQYPPHYISRHMAFLRSLFHAKYPLAWQHRNEPLAQSPQCVFPQPDYVFPWSTIEDPNTVEPVLLHDVRQEAFDVVREVYAVRPGILVLTEKFTRSLLYSFAGYAFR